MKWSSQPGARMATKASSTATPDLAIARDEEHRAGAVAGVVEALEFVALAREFAGRADLARLHRAHRHAVEMRRIVGDVAAGPELAVIDAIDAGLDLALHQRGDRGLDLGGDLLGIGHLAGRELGRHVLPAGGGRQAADMRGPDPCVAVLHGRRSRVGMRASALPRSMAARSAALSPICCNSSTVSSI